MANTGTISQVIGSTFDIQFREDQLPDIYNAVTVEAKTPVGDLRLTGEVQQHLGGGRVRAVALGSTDGLKRGMKALDTGSAVTVPVGEKVLGRVFNLLQRQPRDIDQLRRTFDLHLHQIDQIGAAGDELGARIADDLAQGVGDVGCARILKLDHDCPIACWMAATMLV